MRPTAPSLREQLEAATCEQMAALEVVGKKKARSSAARVMGPVQGPDTENSKEAGQSIQPSPGAEKPFEPKRGGQDLGP